MCEVKMVDLWVNKEENLILTTDELPIEVGRMLNNTERIHIWLNRVTGIHEPYVSMSYAGYNPAKMVWVERYQVGSRKDEPDLWAANIVWNKWQGLGFSTDWDTFNAVTGLRGIRRFVNDNATCICTDVEAGIMQKMFDGVFSDKLIASK